jgi:hypothetical protein
MAIGPKIRAGRSVIIAAHGQLAGAHSHRAPLVYELDDDLAARPRYCLGDEEGDRRGDAGGRQPGQDDAGVMPGRYDDVDFFIDPGSGARAARRPSTTEETT